MQGHKINKLQNKLANVNIGIFHKASNFQKLKYGNKLNLYNENNLKIVTPRTILLQAYFVVKEKENECYRFGNPFNLTLFSNTFLRNTGNIFVLYALLWKI